MTLKEVDVSSIPPDHLSALSSSITQTLYIDNMEGDITPVLLNVKTKYLIISNMKLSVDETLSLVNAMNNVEWVLLGMGRFGLVTLDMETLSTYTGQGRCDMIHCFYETKEKYRTELVTWTRWIGWKIEKEHDNFIVFKNIYSYKPR